MSNPFKWLLTPFKGSGDSQVISHHEISKPEEWWHVRNIPSQPQERTQEAMRGPKEYPTTGAGGQGPHSADRRRDLRLYAPKTRTGQAYQRWAVQYLDSRDWPARAMPRACGRSSTGRCVP